MENRTDAIATLFKIGNTMAEIGREYGISRERVRQILGRLGIKGPDGGARKRTDMREAFYQKTTKENRDAVWRLRHGSTREEVIELTGGLLPSDREGGFYKYSCQKKTAARRGVRFALTFKEWMWIWESSGHINNRGVAKGQYVMARNGDCGAYEIGNVRIISCEENIKESMDLRGVRLTEEQRAAKKKNRHKTESAKKAQVKYRACPEVRERANRLSRERYWKKKNIQN